MNRELTVLLNETRKILAFHQTIGINNYPASDVFLEADNKSTGSTKSKKNNISSTFNTIAPGAAKKTAANRTTEKLQLHEIKAALGDCRRCALHTQRHNIVFGAGNCTAALMIISGWPGPESDLEGSPLKGESGDLLTKMLRAINLTPDEIYLAPLVKCRPKNGNQPRPIEIRTCLPFLLRQIAAVSPKIIWTLGTESAQTLLETDESILQLRGRFHDFRGIIVMPTFHPQALLQNEDLKKPTWLDMQIIQKRLKAIKDKESF